MIHSPSWIHWVSGSFLGGQPPSTYLDPCRLTPLRGCDLSGLGTRDPTRGGNRTSDGPRWVVILDSFGPRCVWYRAMCRCDRLNVSNPSYPWNITSKGTSPTSSPSQPTSDHQFEFRATSNGMPNFLAAPGFEPGSLARKPKEITTRPLTPQL